MNQLVPLTSNAFPALLAAASDQARVQRTHVAGYIDSWLPGEM
jgi:hypothetical protein